MLKHSSVKQNILFCETLFNKTPDLLKKKFLIRMALLEVCGWIEESLDIIYSLNPNNQSLDNFPVMQKHIAHLYSFDYDSVFKTISLSIGVYNAYILESKIKTKHFKEFTKFKGALNNLKKYRNEYAHKNTDQTERIIGFSVLKQELTYTKIGLRRLENEIKKILKNV